MSFAFRMAFDSEYRERVYRAAAEQRLKAAIQRAETEKLLVKAREIEAKTYEGDAARSDRVRSSVEPVL